MAVIARVLPTLTVGDWGVTDTDVKTGVGPVVVLLLPPHAAIAAATVPAAMMRTTLRNMAFAPREGFLERHRQSRSPCRAGKPNRGERPLFGGERCSSRGYREPEVSVH